MRIGSCLAICVDEVERRAARPSASSTTGAGESRMRVLVGVHLATAERLGDQPAVAGVLRRVVLEHVPAGREVVRLHLLERDALRRREHLDVAADLQQVVVAGDGPEALRRRRARPTS